MLNVNQNSVSKYVCNMLKLIHNDSSIESRYSRMDQVKFVEDSL